MKIIKPFLFIFLLMPSCLWAQVTQEAIEYQELERIDTIIKTPPVTEGSTSYPKIIDESELFIGDADDSYVVDSRDVKVSPSKDDEISTIDDIHLNLSRNIFYLTNYIDQFFANDKELDKNNGTRVRIYNTHSFTDENGYSNDTNFRVQLRLPYLKKQLQLAVERRDEDTENRTVVPDSFNSTNGKTPNENVQAGVGYVQKNKKLANFKFSGGLKFNDQPYTFLRARLFRDIFWGAFEFNTSLSIYWDEEDRYSQTFYFDINKKLSNGTLLRWVNEQRWEDTDDTLRTKHGPTFFYKLSPRRFISYYIRAFTRNKPNLVFDNYRLGFGFRQRFHKQWAFYELSPFIDYSRENNFSPAAGVIFKLEFILGAL